jgi:hypothetical protein
MMKRQLQSAPLSQADVERPRKRRLVKLADQPAEEGRASSTKEGELIRVLDHNLRSL